MGVELYFRSGNFLGNFILCFLLYEKQEKQDEPFLPKIGHFHEEILCNKIDRMLNLGHF